MNFKQIIDLAYNTIDETDYDEDEVNVLEERLDLIKDLKRKYVIEKIDLLNGYFELKL